MRASKPEEPLAKLKGRPPVYDAAYHCEHATKFCKLGATNAKLAECFGVSEYTIDKWVRDHPAFNNALAEGRDVADANMTGALYTVGMGAVVPEEKIFFDGTDKEGKPIIHRVQTQKHYPPNVHAIDKWLASRQRKLWGPTRAVSLTEELAAASVLLDQDPNSPKSVTITIKGGLPIGAAIVPREESDDDDGAGEPDDTPEDSGGGADGAA